MKKLLTITMCMIITASLIFVPQKTADAYTQTDFNGWTELGSSTAGRSLSGNYKVTANTTITNSSTGGNGISISGTTCIYIASGATLTVTGANGASNIGGGAGIYLPSGQTLYLFGSGTVRATGGAGYQGSIGGAGGSYVQTGSDPGWYYSLTFTAGNGGNGGRGGSSPGAGIGGNGITGGLGGNGGTDFSKMQNFGASYNGFTRLNNRGGGDYSGVTTGNAGSNGSGGTAGIGMGTLYVLDNVNLTAAAGSRSAAYGSGGSSGRSKAYAGWDSGLNKGGTFTVASGGGGGGGGYSGYSANIGGSGGGGGGGGGGSSGSFFFEYLQGGRNWDTYFFTGNGGGGGGGYGRAGAYGTLYDTRLHNNEPLIINYRNGTSTVGNLTSGGTGGQYTDYYNSAKAGNGGAHGAGGTGGTVYKSPLATITAPVGGNTSNGDGAAASVASYAQTYLVSLDNQSATTSGTGSVDTAYGTAMPTITPPVKTGFDFNGYYSEPNGSGVKYYNAKGEGVISWDHMSDKTLYACWTSTEYSVNQTLENVTSSDSSGAAIYGIEYTAALTAESGYEFTSEKPVYVYIGGVRQDDLTLIFTEASSTALVSIPGGRITGNIIITAEADLIIHDITYVTNGAVIEDQNIPVKFSQLYGEPNLPGTISKHGYEFKGWYYTAGFQGGRIAGIQPGTMADVTLYAKMTPLTPVITFDRQGGELGSDQVTAEFDSLLPFITPPDRARHEFMGYFSEAGGEGIKYYDTDGNGLIKSDFTENTTLYAHWTLIPKNNVSGNIDFNDDTKTYNGRSQDISSASVGGIVTGADPVWTYTYSGTGITDYEKSIVPPTNAGTYSVTAEYEDFENIGTAAAILTINKALISASDIDVLPKTYDGTATATVSAVTFGGLQNGESLTEDNDYDIISSYFSSPDAETNKYVICHISLRSNTKTSNYDLSPGGFTMGAFAISPLDISEISVDAEFEAITYNGGEQTPDPVSTSFGGMAVTRGTDFTLGSYQDNINAGTASAIITGMGNYTGTQGVLFDISKKDVILIADNKTIIVGSSESTYTYSISGLAGSDSKETAIPTPPGLSVDNFDSSTPTTFAINISGGTAGGNYRIAGRNPGTLTITEKTQTNINVTAPTTGLVYGEELGTPGALAENGTGYFNFSYAGALSDENNTPYGPSSEKPTEPGIYTVTAYYEDPFYTGSSWAPFTISLKQLTWNKDGIVEDKVFDNSTAAIVKSEPTIAGTVGSDILNISKGTVAFEGLNAGSRPIASDYDINGTDVWKYNVPVAQPEFAGIITKAPGAAVRSNAAVASKTWNSVTLTAGMLVGSTGQIMEYSAGTSREKAPTSGWTSNLKINGLSSSTTYYVWTRSVENTNYNTGTPAVNTDSFRTDAAPDSSSDKTNDSSVHKDRTEKGSTTEDNITLWLWLFLAVISSTMLLTVKKKRKSHIFK